MTTEKEKKSKGDTINDLQEEPRFQSRSERDVNIYILDRVQDKINIYYKKAHQNRFFHLFLSVLIAICAAVVPVLINLDVGFHNLATLLSVLVTIAVALQEIFRFREHWRNYNLIETSLRREEMLFSMSAGDYAKLKKPGKRLDWFVQRVEGLIEEERKETINMRTNANSVNEVGKKR
jgi:uncharacterized protein DUF4231